MREIRYEQVVQAVRQLAIDACYRLPEDVVEALERAAASEQSETGREIIRQLITNARVAAEELYPLCQDTGLAVVFVEMGNRIVVTAPADRPDATLADAINEGVEAGYRDGFLRKSVVADPANKRINTKTNTPAIIHHRWMAGDRLKLTLIAKGGGCENRSRFAMLKPAEGAAGVERFVVETVAQAGADACPPFVVGVGIGGDFEQCCLLAKRSLLRPINSRHSEQFYADMERRLLQRINALGIGPQGFGGSTTALAVLIETAPCHIASLPVAVNIECHSHRHKSITI